MHRRAIVVLLALLAVAPAVGLTAPPAFAVTTTEKDAYTTAEDTPLSVPAPGVLSNDTTDPDKTLCVTAFDADDLQGSLGPGDPTDGSFIFTPNPNWNGSTTFTYDVALLVGADCGETVEGTATVTITVEAVNDPPTAVADSFTAVVNRTLNIAAPGVLRNDSDPIEGDSLTAVKVENPAHGVVTLASDGAFSYTPVSGFAGTDQFAYQARDGSAASETVVVTLRVTAIPTPPPTAPPTPAPTPTPEITDEPSPTPSASTEPSPSASPSVAPSSSASSGPTATPGPGDPTTSAGGLSIPVIVVGLLLLSLLAFGAAAFVPKWLARQRAGAEIDDDGYLDDEEIDDR